MKKKPTSKASAPGPTSSQISAAYAPVVSGFAGATAIYYLLISLSHPFFETGSELVLLETPAIFAGLWAATVWRFLRRKPLDMWRLEAAAGLIYLLFFINIAAYLSIHFVPHKLIYFVLLALVSGTTAPTLRLAISGVGLSMIGLVAFGARAEQDFIDQYAFMGLAGSFASLGMTSLMRGAVLRELKARVAAEALTLEAQAAARAQAAFLATMSHELRTPLNGVIGMAQAMERDHLPAAQRERLGVVQDSANGLLAVISDILEISQMDAGRTGLQPVRFDVSQFADRLRTLYAPIAVEKGLTFRLTCEAEEQIREGDPSRLRQIATHLINNAVKFTPKGRIDVEISADRDTLVLVVRDTGIGIAPEDHSRVFERFYQADGSATRSFGGAGLGLTITSELVRLMGGTITLQAAPGKGSCFTVTLPAPAAEAAPERERGAGKTRPALDGARVLVVDDNASNRLVLEVLLAPYGVEVACAADGQQGLEAWEHGRYDAVLMDIHMPVMDGVTATRSLRRREQELRLTPTPVIAVTASVAPKEMQAYLAAGMDAVVAKPVDPELLLDKLAGKIAALGRPQSGAGANRAAA